MLSAKKEIPMSETQQTPQMQALLKLKRTALVNVITRDRQAYDSAIANWRGALDNQSKISEEMRTRAYKSERDLAVTQAKLAAADQEITKLKQELTHMDGCCCAYEGVISLLTGKTFPKPEPEIQGSPFPAMLRQLFQKG